MKRPVPTPLPQKLTTGSGENPCVRNCCLDDEDVCVGCGRSLAEITGWHGMSTQEREAVLKAATERLGARRW